MNRNQLTSLLNALSKGDKQSVINALVQASSSEHKKNLAWAMQLQGYASALERRSGYDQKFLTLLNPSGKRNPSLDCFDIRVPLQELANVILPADLREEISSMLLAQQSRELLEQHDLFPPCRIMLIGDPGTGKTILAEAIAHSLSKQICSMRMGRLIQSHLGETISNIENAFAAISQHDAVYFFDEFDAISTSRNGGSQDVNEMRRSINALLIEIENHRGPALIIAATNRPDVMDTAFRRRFDYVWEMPPPSAEGRLALIRRVLEKHSMSYDEQSLVEIQKALADLSYDECEDITKKLVIRSILSNTPIHAAMIQETQRRSIGSYFPLVKSCAGKHLGQLCRPLQKRTPQKIP